MTRAARRSRRLSVRRLALLSFALLGSIGGCGQKGPLVLPAPASGTPRVVPPAPERGGPTGDDDSAAGAASETVEDPTDAANETTDGQADGG